jgi:hypothetical protein
MRDIFAGAQRGMTSNVVADKMAMAHMARAENDGVADMGVSNWCHGSSAPTIPLWIVAQ